MIPHLTMIGLTECERETSPMKTVNCSHIKKFMNFNIAKLFLLQTALVILVYIAGVIVGAFSQKESELEYIKKSVRALVTQNMEEILSDVILQKNDSLQKRLQTLQDEIKRISGKELICISIDWPDTDLYITSCPNSSVKNSLLTEMNLIFGNFANGSIRTFRTNQSFFDITVRGSIHHIAFFVIWSLTSTILIFLFAKRTVVGPITDLVAKQSRQSVLNSTLQMIAHDIRRPFSYLTIIFKRLEDAVDIADVKSILLNNRSPFYSSITEVNHAIKQILGKSSEPITKNIVNLSICIRSCIKRINIVHESRAADITLELDESIYVKGNPIEISRSIENILTNAIEATTDNQKIEINLYKNENFASIEIWNFGSSIDPSISDKIFSPFFTMGKTSGTGLGLAIANEIVYGLGGALEFKNKNSGVSFIIRLPHMSTPASNPHFQLTSHSEVDSSNLAITKEGKIRRQVLVLEDDFIFQDNFVQMNQLISKEGISVDLHLTDTIEAALESIVAKKPEIIILDLHIGSESVTKCINLIKIILQMKLQTKIVVHSNALLSPIDEDFLNSCQVTTENKPMSLASFRNLILNKTPKEESRQQDY